MHTLKKTNPNILLQNCIFIPLPATKMFKDAIALGYKPPTTLKGWAARSTTARIEERNDITWMNKSTLDEYTKIYKEEFGDYKNAFEKEKTGEYVSPIHD